MQKQHPSLGKKMNRLFLALSLLILVVFLGAPSTEGDLDFALLGATSKSYRKFIQNLRDALPKKEQVYNIPVLQSSVSDSKRFILINLSNYDGKTITIAIDVINVYVVAYRSGDTSYILKKAPSQTSKLFEGTTHKPLPYSGNYEDLQTAAGKIREKIELGLPALDSAITTMLHYDSVAVPGAFIVVIQTVAEAARFKYIEVQISNYVSSQFLPSLSIVSLENKWSALSKQIQIAKDRHGQFENPVLIVDPEGKRVEITNVTSKVVTANIALLLYKGNVPSTEDGVSATVNPRAAAVSEEDETTVVTMGRKSIDNGSGDYLTEVLLSLKNVLLN